MQRFGSELIIEVEDVIKPEKVEKYKKELDEIWDQLKFVANNLIIMERLSCYPYHLFVPDFKSTFWILTNKAYFDSTIMIFSNILSQAGESPSLRRLKNSVLNAQDFRILDIDSQVLDLLKTRIKTVDFETNVKPLEYQIRAVRNHHIAHLDPRKVTTPENIIAYSLPLKTFKQALKVADQLFQILGLGTYHQLEYWSYSPSSEKLDIDEILEFVAGNSFWFSDDPIVGAHEEYEKLSEKDKSIIDEWRKKLGK